MRDSIVEFGISMYSVKVFIPEVMVQNLVTHLYHRSWAALTPDKIELMLQRSSVQMPHGLYYSTYLVSKRELVFVSNPTGDVEGIKTWATRYFFEWEHGTQHSSPMTTSTTLYRDDAIDGEYEIIEETKELIEPQQKLLENPDGK